jgi:hypothetical protein
VIPHFCGEELAALLAAAPFLGLAVFRLRMAVADFRACRACGFTLWEAVRIMVARRGRPGPFDGLRHRSRCCSGVFERQEREK